MKHSASSPQRPTPAWHSFTSAPGNRCPKSSQAWHKRVYPRKKNKVKHPPSTNSETSCSFSMPTEVPSRSSSWERRSRDTFVSSGSRCSQKVSSRLASLVLQAGRAQAEAGGKPHSRPSSDSPFSPSTLGMGSWCCRLLQRLPVPRGCLALGPGTKESLGMAPHLELG